MWIVYIVAVFLWFVLFCFFPPVAIVQRVSRQMSPSLSGLELHISCIYFAPSEKYSQVVVVVVSSSSSSSSPPPPQRGIIDVSVKYRLCRMVALRKPCQRAWLIYVGKHGLVYFGAWVRAYMYACVHARARSCVHIESEPLLILSYTSYRIGRVHLPEGYVQLQLCLPWLLFSLPGVHRE